MININKNKRIISDKKKYWFNLVSLKRNRSELYIIVLLFHLIFSIKSEKSFWYYFKVLFSDLKKKNK